MTEMTARLPLIAPEILLFVGAVVVAIFGLSKSRAIRESVPWVSVVFLCGSVVVTAVTEGCNQCATVATDVLLFPNLSFYTKTLIGVVGVGLVLVGIGSVDRRYETAIRAGRASFDPLRVIRGEYHAFFLLSICGTMLLSSASDLVWLFLAIELSSLPTYVMCAIGRGTKRNSEAAVKYFFIGAMSTATFLYGFALLYGATGTTELLAMKDIFASQAATAAGIPLFGILGMVLAIVGLCFKITAVPMHFYAPDVYQGAPTPVTAFLAFMPKIAGFIAIILLVALLGWQGHGFIDSAGIRVPIEGLPRPVHATLWIIAVLTMILGNVGALLQSSVKRLLAYSSVAHSGYLLVGVLAGTAAGLTAVFFYLATYAIATIAIFGALAGLERRGREIDTLDDLAGIWQKHKAMAAVIAVAAFSMVGLPPLIGFFGKLELVIAAIAAGEVPLVVIMMVTSAISAYYYLRLAGVPLSSTPDARSEGVVKSPRVWPRVAAIACGLGVLLSPLAARPLMKFAETISESSYLAENQVSEPTSKP
jgi:NADH-quinone oxidoreductase subunit N